MKVFDKILDMTLIQDLTETSWWTDTVFRGLELDGSNEQGMDTEVAGTAGQLTSEV